MIGAFQYQRYVVGKDVMRYPFQMDEGSHTTKMEKKRYKWILPRYLISAPLIYVQIIPIVILDILFELYHRIAFPLYGLPLVKRRAYIIIDRHKLAYLNWFEKLNCAYCGYVNGVLLYGSAIAAETEKYWCGIMHAKYGKDIPKHHKGFAPYGDKDAYDAYVKEREEKYGK